MKSFMKCSFLVSKAVLLSVFCLFCVITGKANEEVTIGGLNYMLCYNDDFSDYYASVSDNLNFSGTSVTIPEKIRHTVSYQENGETKSVTLDFPVISIGHGAFKQCENLTSVTTGNRVERIGGYAFIGCINLTSVTIGNRVEIIGDLAFAECENLTSVTIGNRVKEIGGGAFQYCSSITDLCVGDSVRYVHSSAFYGVSPKNLIWKAKKYYTRDSEDAVGSEIIKMDCSNVENLTILQPAERLPERFCSGAKITSVNVPDYVTYIGANAFSGCRNLTHVTIGDNMTSDEDHVLMVVLGLRIYILELLFLRLAFKHSMEFPPRLLYGKQHPVVLRNILMIHIYIMTCSLTVMMLRNYRYYLRQVCSQRTFVMGQKSLQSVSLVL